ncbi:hypothetical protein BRD15_10185 [Halobacteriales archaeon SW_6_65_15]|nr:MAG: hypothetical protein BRD15_10185 [Halobacteriales archaeon SW_6_65_15]
MISLRFQAFLSTLLLVLGALIFGQAIHGGVVTGRYPVVSTWVVGRLVGGTVLMAVGARFQVPTEEYVSMPSGDPDRSDGTTDPTEESAEFDSELSPLGDDDLEHLDADDDRRE